MCGSVDDTHALAGLTSVGSEAVACEPADPASCMQALATVMSDGQLAIHSCLQADLWEEMAESVPSNTSGIPAFGPGFLAHPDLRQQTVRCALFEMTCLHLEKLETWSRPLQADFQAMVRFSVGGCSAKLNAACLMVPWDRSIVWVNRSCVLLVGTPTSQSQPPADLLTELHLEWRDNDCTSLSIVAGEISDHATMLNGQDHAKAELHDMLSWPVQSPDNRAESCFMLACDIAGTVAPGAVLTATEDHDQGAFLQLHDGSLWHCTAGAGLQQSRQLQSFPAPCQQCWPVPVDDVQSGGESCLTTAIFLWCLPWHAQDQSCPEGQLVLLPCISKCSGGLCCQCDHMLTPYAYLS